MSTLLTVEAIRLRGQSYDLSHLFGHLLAGDRLDHVLNVAAEEITVAENARQAGLTVSDDELQRGADELRLALGLRTAHSTCQWLERRRWTTEDFETMVERRLLKGKLAKYVCGERVEAYFALHRAEFDSADVSHLVVADEHLAWELLAQLEEDEGEFAVLAARYSEDKATSQTSGRLGLLPLSQLPEPLRDLVANAQDGQTVGPVTTARGFHLVRVERLIRAELTPAVRATIRDRLFAQWLKEQTRGVEVSPDLLNALR